MKLFFRVTFCLIIVWAFYQNAHAACYRSNPNHLWPSSRIPYKIDPDWPESVKESIETAHQAAAYLSAATNLCLVPATPQDSVYIVIGYSTGGACTASTTQYTSYAAIASGFNMPSIKCGYSLVTNCHEFMHLLGFDHEQKRPDRDDHVIVYDDCIKTNYIGQYSKLHDAYWDMSPVYDYHSIMHYRDHTGRKFDCSVTMESINFPNVELGQRSFLSPIDVAAINSAYPEVCDDCSNLETFHYNFNGRVDSINDGWGEKLIPYVFNSYNSVDVDTIFYGSMYLSSSEYIELGHGFSCTGFDEDLNETETCFTIESCPGNANKSTDNLVNSNGFIKSELSMSIFPNPVRTSAILELDIPKDDYVTIQILDINGRLIRNVLETNFLQVGKSEIELNIEDIDSGIYFCKVISETGSAVKKIYKH